MKYLRAELHNHSPHSDGELTVPQLVDYAAAHSFGVLALTDHNTVSGHAAAWRALQEKAGALELLPGVEVTTFWGHILALGLTQMVDFTQLDPYAPELFLRGLKAAGARAVGIAHPFCVGEPVMVGCRFAMELHDWSAVDYIEVFNTAVDDTTLGGTALGEALGGNRHALELWEHLVLSGHRIAAVTGKDLHAVPGEQTVFTTYALTADDSPLRGADAVLAAILNQRTLLSKGPLFYTCADGGRLTVRLDSAGPEASGVPLTLEVRDSTGTVQCGSAVPGQNTEFRLPAGARSAVVRLYEGACDYGHLLAVGAPVYLGGGNAQ